MNTGGFSLSKSTFLKGHQCPKALYLHKHHPELRDDLGDSVDAVLEQGINVGLLARELFPNGIDLTPRDFTQYPLAAEETAKAIAKGEKVLYESTFLYDEVMCAPDILVNSKEGWTCYEVKSSTQVKDVYILDAALQYYVMAGKGIKPYDFYIVYINNEYIRKGALDFKRLFAMESVLQDVLELQPEIAKKVAELKATVKDKSVPSMDIGEHCGDPYPCDFSGHCWGHIPENSVFDIANLRSNKKFDLYQKGIVGFKDIPASYSLNDKQWQQVNCELKQETIIDRAAIKKFVSTLQYPLRHLDFETCQFAIPVFDDSRPYQQIVFQYSLHLQNSPGEEATHYEYLAKPEPIDPRPAFIQSLLRDCGEDGDILVYNIGFERGKLKSLAETFPKYAEALEKIISRLKDLMVPFRDRMYYVPEMRGSYSIKQVLPALVPELSYRDMKIADGGTASNIYASMVQGLFQGDVIHMQQALKEYCKMDTFAMVKILDKLIQLQ